MTVTITEKYVMTSDAYNFILNTVETAKTGKNAGKTLLIPIGYYPRVSELIRGLISHHMRQSTTRTLKTFLRELTAFHDEIRSAFND